MKKIYLLGLLVFLQQALAFDGFTYNGYYQKQHWSNNKLAENIEVYLKAGGSIDAALRTDYTLKDIGLLQSVYTYKWEHDPYSDKQTEGLIKGISPFIKSFEKLNNCTCNDRCFSPPDIAKDYSPSNIPHFQIIFVSKDDPEKKYFFSVDIYNTNSKTLVVSVSSLLPLEMQNFGASKK